MSLHLPLSRSAHLIISSLRSSLIPCRMIICAGVTLLLATAVHAQNLDLGTPCVDVENLPCRPSLANTIHKSPSVFYLQARVSPAKLPSGRGSIRLSAKLYGDQGNDPICTEEFPHPFKIRKGVLNVEVGRGMDCALDEVLMENQRVQLQLCIGTGGDSCLRRIDLTAVPFALSAHSAIEVKKAKTATRSARADFAHRVTADLDVLHPTQMGYGYFDFFTPSPERVGVFNTSLGLAEADLPADEAGFILWTPVRGARGGEDALANHILFVSESQQEQLRQLTETSLHTQQATVTGRAQIQRGHVLVKGSSDVVGSLRVKHQLQAFNKTTVQRDLSVQGDSIVMRDLTRGAPMTVQGDARLRAQVEVDNLVARQRMVVRQKSATLGDTYVTEEVTLRAASERADAEILMRDNLVVRGKPVDDNGESYREGLTASQAVQVNGDGASVMFNGETRLVRELNTSDPSRSADQGLFMKQAENSAKRVLSLRQSGSIELNMPKNQADQEISEVVIKAEEVRFKDLAEVPIESLSSSCKLVPQGNKLVFRCGTQSFSFASDQCGNGRRFRCSCGDGNIDPSEECDDGDNNSNSSGCLKSCALARCGDQLVRSDLSDPNAVGYEECDDGDTDDYDACRTNCLEATCGDGLRRVDLTVSDEGYEECDDGQDTDTCNQDCTLARCGDAYHNPAAEEECDDGQNTDTCNQDCTLARCGDAYHNPAAEEECDDGQDTARCDQDCTTRICGDNYINSAAEEECDDGNSLDSDGCTARCKFARCGDGIHRSDRSIGQADYEACDDGNSNEYDVCRNDCTLHCNQIDKVGHFIDQGGDIVVDTSLPDRRSSPVPSQTQGGGPQVAIGITLTERKYAILKAINQTYDSYFYLRSSCDGPGHIAYDDDSGGYFLPKIEQFLDPGTYYLIVDGYRQRSGESTVNLSLADCRAMPISLYIDYETRVYSLVNFIFRIFGLPPVRSSFTIDNTGGVDVAHRNCGGDGPQRAVRFTLPWAATVEFETTSGSDPVLHLRDNLDCSRFNNLICDDDSGSGLNAKITTTLSAGTYYLIVDGYNKRSGTMTVEYTIK